MTNGLTLRLLRDSTFVRRQAYVEFDLRQIFEEQRFTDFRVLYRLLHRTRLPRASHDAPNCLLEAYHQHATEQGGRVRERLRDGVEECIKRLANGFLAHPKNSALRAQVVAPHSGGAGGITPEELYHQLLRLVYRLLFLLVSEDRGLISANRLYHEHYSVTRLCRLVDRRSSYTEHDDVWCSLRVLWKLLSAEDWARYLDLPPLDGELFHPLALDAYTITNRHFLEAFWHLTYYQQSASAPPRRVNYAALDVEELGSVYESLLEYHPQIDTSGTAPRFELQPGSERKSTGSYYTPPELVSELIRSALDPVIEERLKNARTAEEKKHALLSIRVVDPACGSGHFLLAAARRLGKELAKIHTGEEEPAPERVREAIREVVGRCIYGVDKNPLAVELCRVALWLETHCAGKPLSFLDHRIRCGDSLVGVFDLSVWKAGIPDAAFEPVSGDNAEVARAWKRENAKQRQGQRVLPFDAREKLQQATASRRPLLETADDTLAQVRQKADAWKEWQRTTQRDSTACTLWTAAFFQTFTNDNEPRITTDTLFHCLDGTDAAHAETLDRAQALSAPHHFFHWPLEFPEVFTEGGFDVVLCNPPWERIKLQEQEFFATKRPDVANARNKAERQRRIQQLAEEAAALWHEYQQALHYSESLSKFLRHSGRFPLTGRGDINTYSVFTELARQLLNPKGRAGLVVPTGIATDNTNKQFFSDLVQSGSLVSFFDFENREAMFPAVDRRYKFSLVTMRSAVGVSRGSWQLPEFAFFCTRASHLRQPQRRFTLSFEDLALLNPNTGTCPVFRTRADAELTKAIYRRVPVLVRESLAPPGRKQGEFKTKPASRPRTREEAVGSADPNPWHIAFFRMFDMANDSGLFRTRDELEAAGYHLVGNRFVVFPASPGVSAVGPQTLVRREHASASDTKEPTQCEQYWLVPSALEQRMAKVAEAWRPKATTAEQILWQALRNRELGGVEFCRQQRIGPFVVDFCAPKERLVVEVEGGGSVTPEEEALARERQRLLECLGFRVLRIAAATVEQDFPKALARIRAALALCTMYPPS